MAVYVVRHAKAGERSDWTGDDRTRPLTRSGQRQAEALADLLGSEPIEKVLTSGYTRCEQTVQPLATRLKLPLKPVKELEEGAGSDGVLRLIEKNSGRDVVLCTHGDVMEDLLEGLIARGLVQRAGASMEKGSTWVLEERDGKVTGARYLPAPRAN